MWHPAKLKKLNGPEEELDTEKSLVYELIQHLEDAKRSLTEIESSLQASYHVCKDLVYVGDVDDIAGNPTVEALFSNFADQIVSVAKQIRKSKAELTDVEVKSWIHHTTKNKSKAKRTRKKKK